MVKHTFNVTENCTDKMKIVESQFKGIKDPLIHQISNLISQNELLQREVERSQQINYGLINNCVKYITDFKESRVASPTVVENKGAKSASGAVRSESVSAQGIRQ